MRSSRYERAPLPLSRAQCAAAALMAWRLAISPLSRRPVSAAARSLDRTYAQRRLCKAMRPGSRARPPPHRGARANATHTIRERSHTRNPLLLSSQCPAVPSPRDSLARVQRQVPRVADLSPSLSLSRPPRCPPLPLSDACVGARCLASRIMSRGCCPSSPIRDPCVPRAVGERASYRQSAGVRAARSIVDAHIICACAWWRNHGSSACALLLQSPCPLPSFFGRVGGPRRGGGAGSRSWFKADDGSYPVRRAPPRGGRDVVEVDGDDVDGDDGKCPPMPARLLLLLPNFPLSRRWAEARRVPEVCLCPLEAPVPLRCVR